MPCPVQLRMHRVAWANIRCLIKVECTTNRTRGDNKYYIFIRVLLVLTVPIKNYIYLKTSVSHYVFQ